VGLSGFCLLNSIAVGAAYARCMYGRNGPFKRVAIIDFDSACITNEPQLLSGLR
jgi:acetoin utilization deacetylase AcuC-like enzyme